MSWVKSPRLWALAMKRAAEERPKWTDAYWRKVKEIYTSNGGRLEEVVEGPENVEQV